MGLLALGGEETEQLHVLLLKVRTEIQNTFEKYKILEVMRKMTKCIEIIMKGQVRVY